MVPFVNILDGSMHLLVMEFVYLIKEVHFGLI